MLCHFHSAKPGRNVPGGCLSSMNDAPTIAIVGVGGIFPRSPNLDAFWNNILHGVDTASEVPADRWLLSAEDVFQPGPPAPDKVYSRRACTIESYPLDLTGLAVNRAFVEQLDPMFHLALHAGGQAFHDGVTANLDRGRVGVIMGNIALPTDRSSALAREILGQSFDERALGQQAEKQPSAPVGQGTHPFNRYVTGLPAGVLAKALGLGGGSATVDAACASSLYALKLAADELLAGRADAMLAGGLSRPDCLYTQMGFSQLRALSPKGRCSPFDAKADGLVVGEGAGMVLLKRLEDALRDGDKIYAVIRGIGLSNDLGGSLLAPSSEGQLRALRPPYEQARWSPQDVDLIECHATGTPVGDAVEFESLKSLWGDRGWAQGQCVIGSVKSNIGHALTGAGAAGLLKVLFAIRNKTLPPTANFVRAGPSIHLDNSPFLVLSEARPWEIRDSRTPRRAAVSAFGFGGINAHVLLEEWTGKEPVAALSRPPSSSVPGRAPRPAEVAAVRPAARPPVSTAIPIAIVGIEAHFGPWGSLSEFRQRVLGGGADVEPGPPRAWWGVEKSSWFREKGLQDCPFKGFFIDALRLPMDRFRIPPKELEEMLAQQLLLLDVVRGARLDAGLGEEASMETGVFVGIGLDLNTTHFSFRWSLLEKARAWSKGLGLGLPDAELEEWVKSLRDAAGPALSANRTMGALGGIVASRVAREYRIGGPSFTLSSEESSGLKAVELAVRALQKGELKGAIVGAVDLAGEVRAALGAHANRPYSSSGQIRPLDPSADGSILGEGAAAVVLKPLEDAAKEGDKIYAVIRGFGSALGGQATSAVPQPAAYQEAMTRAYREAGIDPGTIGYLETHGSGLPEEDRIEAAAISEFFRTRGRREPCALGSVKADVGHTGAASGLASLLKACLCLYYEMLPALRNTQKILPELSTEDFHFFLPRHPQYWLRNRSDGPRRAAVSSFSVDGNCTHAVLEAYEPADYPRARPDRLQPLGARNEGLFAIEADDVSGLREGLGHLGAVAERSNRSGIEALAREWRMQHPENPVRKLGLALMARNTQELLDQVEFATRSLSTNPGRALEGNGRGSSSFEERIFYSPHPVGLTGQVAFVFPGSGNHYLGMGRELSAQWPEVLRRQDLETDTLRCQLVPDLLWNAESTRKLNRNPKAIIFSQVALGTLVSDLIRSFGVQPHAVIGYSLGESAGLFSLQVWRDRDGMLRRMNASTLFTSDLTGRCDAVRKAWNQAEGQAVDWTVGVVDRPENQVREAMRGRARVYLLIVNTPQECVIGGDSEAVKGLVSDLGCKFLRLRGVITVHCEVAREVERPYRDLHLFPTTPPPGVRFYSGVLGQAYEVNTESAAESILGQALKGFDFTRVIESAYADGVRLFLEMGPGASCSRMIRQILEGRPHLARSACVLGQDSVTTVLSLLGTLIAERVPVDLNGLYGRGETVVVSPPREEEPQRESSRTLVIPLGGKPFEVNPPARRLPSSEEKAVPAASPSPLLRPRPAFPPPIPASPPSPSAFEPFPSASLVQKTLAASEARAEAHKAYLRFVETNSQAVSRSIAFQMALLERMRAAGHMAQVQAHAPVEPAAVPAARPSELERGAVSEEQPAGSETVPADPSAESPPSLAPHPPRALDRHQCLEFATGSIGRVLGPDYAEVDAFPTRVRLPDEPLMLVDRILSIEGQPRSMTRGRVVTEHDIHPGDWYLDGGRIPTCIAVEAGQADLFLSGYLGIDFQTRGLAVYRLLDAQVTFHRGLPGPNETIHYDIRIERFFRHGAAWFFNFSFEGTVRGQPLLTMKNGCAGFFTQAELDSGAGIVQTERDRRQSPGARPKDLEDLPPMSIESYGDHQVEALKKGDLARCFGPLFDGLPLKNPLRLPGGRMKLVDRVLRLDPRGGRYGLGLIRAEADIHPDDWFLTCHFVDDRVMPGTLMYECCMHTLRIFLLRMGWVGEQEDVVYEPIPGITSELKCRGQVIETTQKAVYEISIKELGYSPAPYAIVDALMYSDGKPVVAITQMSCQLTGLDRDKIQGFWRQRRPPSRPARKAALFEHDRILAFAIGKPSKAFGEPYKVFDEGRVIARLPGPPYQFLHRITEIRGEPWKMVAGGEIEAQYDIPPDAWYFHSNRQPRMPFAVLLEVALQPCGWLAAYVGSALTSPIDLSFRNLGGSAVQREAVHPRSGTLTSAIRLTQVSSSGGMIIQNYEFEVRGEGGPLYSGETYFGFFSKQALGQQIGLRGAQPYSPVEAEVSRGTSFDYPKDAPFPDDQLRMIEHINLYVPGGGPSGLGFIRGSMVVNPDAWFFKAHFYQDPVIPGSLGLDSFLQLLKVIAVDRWGWDPEYDLEAMALREKHEWVYRGQVIPTDQKVTVQAEVTFMDEEQRLLRADGFLMVDGRIIYQMKNFAARQGRGRS